MIINVYNFSFAALISSIIRFLAGFEGIVGGYIQMLLLATNVAKTQRLATGTTLLAVLFPISIGAVIEYYKSNDIDIPLSLIITFFYIIAALYGTKSNEHFKEHIPLYALAITMGITSVYFGIKGYHSLMKVKKINK